MYEALTGDTAVCAVGRDRYWTVLYNTARPDWGWLTRAAPSFARLLLRSFARSLLPPPETLKRKLGLNAFFAKFPKKNPQ